MSDLRFQISSKERKWEKTKKGKKRQNRAVGGAGRRQMNPNIGLAGKKKQLGMKAVGVAKLIVIHYYRSEEGQI
jgi:hypothetical protein